MMLLLQVVCFPLYLSKFHTTAFFINTETVCFFVVLFFYITIRIINYVGLLRRQEQVCYARLLDVEVTFENDFY